MIALRSPSEEGIIISIDGEEISLPYSAIVYTQTDRNYIRITDREGKVFRTRMTFSDISKLENGTRNPSVNLLKRLADGMVMALKIEFVPKQSI